MKRGQKLMPLVLVGQVWKDDKRSAGRELVVTKVTKDKVWARSGGSDKSRPFLRSRFRPTSTGYRLVQGAPGSELLPGEKVDFKSVTHAPGQE